MDDIIEISSLDLDNNFDFGSTPKSSNFGSGIELLMNDKIKDNNKPKSDIDLDDLNNLENELKGMTRSNSLCATAKYKPVDSNLVERIDTVVVNKENNDCTNDFKILPRGYINHLV